MRISEPFHLTTISGFIKNLLQTIKHFLKMKLIIEILCYILAAAILYTGFALQAHIFILIAAMVAVTGSQVKHFAAKKHKK
jgi:hypothetical protein